MGFDHSTYFAYGIRIPDIDPDLIEDADLPTGISYLLAGSYDRDMTFLTTQCTEVSLGSYKAVDPQGTASDEYELWNRRLAEAAQVLGVTPESEPAWLAIPDVS